MRLATLVSPLAAIGVTFGCLSAEPASADAWSAGLGETVRLAAGPSSSSTVAAPAQPGSSGGGVGYGVLAGGAGSATSDPPGSAVLDLPRPDRNPGPQRDIALTKIASGPDLATVASQIPDLGWYDRTIGEPCRIDWIERCAWVSEELGNTLYEGLREAGTEPSSHQEPYFYVSRFGPADRLIISRSASFGEGDFTIVNLLTDRAGRPEASVAIPVSRQAQGFDTGDPSAGVAVLSAAQDEEGAIYLTIDTPSRCGDRPRKAGLLVKTDASVETVAWG